MTRGQAAALRVFHPDGATLGEIRYMRAVGCFPQGGNHNRNWQITCQSWAAGWRPRIGTNWVRARETYKRNLTSVSVFRKRLQDDGWKLP